MSKNLAGKEGGIRIDVPFHLKGSHRQLQSLAFNMKTKKPSMRRNIRFNDNTMDLSMDFSFDGNSWKTVEPTEAAEAMRSRQERSSSVSTEELAEILGE